MDARRRPEPPSSSNPDPVSETASLSEIVIPSERIPFDVVADSVLNGLILRDHHAGVVRIVWNAKRRAGTPTVVRDKRRRLDRNAALRLGLWSTVVKGPIGYELILAVTVSGRTLNACYYSQSLTITNNTSMDVNGMERRTQGESTYVNSLAAATIPPTASPPISRKTVTSSAEQERDRQAEEFSKSVTIIFWYKGKTEPLRLQQMIPTFPYFQLSRLGNLITDLGLTTGSYLDTYVPTSGQWEQHIITSVRVVDSQQRLLYRVRKNLFDGLSEDDCVGLRDEVRLQRASAGYQPHPPQVLETVSPHSLKRYAAEPLENTQPAKIHVPNNYYIDADKTPQASATSNAPVSLPTPPSTAQVLPASTQDESTYIYRPQQQPPQQQSPQQQQQQQAPQQNYYASPAATPGTVVPSPYATSDKDHVQHSVPVHYPPHPPLKRWPNDYTVYELTVGFNAMDQLIAQSPAGDNMTQRVAFERIFGLRYVKSTVCRHRAIWKKADAALRQQFEALGTDQRACWGEFVRRVEGRPSGKPAGAAVPGGTTTSASTTNIVRMGATALTIDFHYQNIANGGAEEHQQHQGEPVMDSLQIPGGPGQGSNVAVGSSLQGSGAMPGQIYDPSLAHMSANAHA